MYAQVKSEDLIPKVRQTIDQYLEQIKKQPIDRARLERVKSHLRYAFALSLNSPGAVAFQAARAISLTGDVHSLSKIYEEYQKVSPEDIQRVARQTFRPDNETVITLSHPGADKPAATQGGK
jgi:zinc protease